ncbi:MAG TPA: helix-turn-helix domain-containing protein [Mucilaginibacter sp.]|nr:helix-turn-helix domain-containing protein [Mucilaginibacter sp.]
MYISLGIVDFFILFLALQGLIISVLLAYSAKKIKNNYRIAVLVFVIAETALVNEAMQSGYWQAHTEIIPFVPLLRLAIGPLLYFYTRGLIKDEVKLKRRDYWHFLPLLLDAQSQVIALLYVTRILAIPVVQRFYFSYEVQSILFRRGTILDNLPVFISLSVYSVISYGMIRRRLSDKQQSVYKQADLKRARNIIYVMAALAFGLLITMLIYAYSSVWDYYIIYIPATLFIYVTSMAIYRRHSHMTTEDILEYNKPIGKVYFTGAEAVDYSYRLNQLMEFEKIYLDPLLKMDMLAEKLSLTERSVSNLLNHHIGKGFNDFINEYRVEEAKRRLIDPATRQFTIAAIGLDCGFNSLATFQRCFKQFTGVTPGQYQRSVIGQIMLKS